MKNIIFTLIMFIAGAVSADPFKVNVAVNARNPEITAPLTQCIKDKIVDMLTARGVSVQFTDFNESYVDVFVASQPITVGAKDEVVGQAAAITVDMRNIAIVPSVAIVTGSLQFLCDGAGETFAEYMTRLAMHLRASTQTPTSLSF